MKGKKLPDLFVQFKDVVAWGAYYKREHGKEDGDKFTVDRYTTAKPAKMCRWVRRFQTELLEWKTGCGLFADCRYKFCPYCGGKIRVRK